MGRAHQPKKLLSPINRTVGRPVGGTEPEALHTVKRDVRFDRTP